MMRRGWALGAALLLALVARGERSHAEDETPTPSEAAAVVLAATEAGDTARLRTLLEAEDAEPWPLAHELCVLGEARAARSFVRASTLPSLRPLQTYVGHQIRVRPSVGLWRHRGRVLALAAAGQWFDLVAYVEEHRIDLEGRDVPTIEIVRALATARLALEEFPEAAVHLRSMADLAEATGWVEAAVEALDQAARVANEGRQFELMIECKRRELTVHNRTGNRRGAAMALANLGVVYGNLADWPRAIEHFQPAVEQYADVLPKGIQVRIRAYLGLAFLRYGQIADAQSILTAALEEAQALDDVDAQGMLSEYLGHVSLVIGEYDEAEARFEASLATYVALEDVEMQAQVIGNLGLLAYEREDYDTALELWERCLDLYEEVEERLGAARARLGIGAVYGKREEWNRALRVLRGALREMMEIRDREGVCMALDEVSLVYHGRGDLQRALSYRRRQLDMARDVASIEMERNGLTALAKLHVERGEFAAALTCARQAMDSIDLTFDRLPQGQAAAAREKAVEVYQIGLVAAVGAGSEADACRFLEGGRAGALLVALEGRSDIRAVQVNEALSRQETEARSAEAAAHGSYMGATRDGNLRAARDARGRLRIARTALRETIERIQLEEGIAADLLYPTPLELDEIQAEIGEGEVLISYGNAGAVGAVALVCTSEEARLVRLGPMSVIDEACQAASALMARGAEMPDVAPLRALVVDPLGIPEGTHRLLVSPIRGLAYFPPSLLFEEWESAYLPSATTWVRLKRVEIPGSREVLAFGDPAYGETPVPARHADSVAVRGGRFVPIPATRDEVEALGTDVRLGVDATETALRSTLAKGGTWKAIHLACHGIVDENEPSYSALALTWSEQDNGLLTVVDVYQLQVSAELVALSACETGRGRYLRAEGIEGMARAFMVAGAPRVLVSLWKVEDEATRALMTRFYELWNPPADGPEPLAAAAALRGAQDYVRNHEKWAHPYWWAGWALWGLAN